MKDEAAVSLGKRGGQKTASLYGKEHFKKIAKGWPKGKKRKKKLESEDEKINDNSRSNRIT